MSDSELKEASYWNKQESGNVQCQLCPHFCQLKNGQTGICKTRRNNNGVLMDISYGLLCSESLDPVEKKPFYHFFPGQKIYSIGSIGCNFKCGFCQNWEISQCGPSDAKFIYSASQDQIIEKALKSPNNCGIAFTYNEPGINYDFTLETAKRAKKAGLATAMVSNAFLNPEPLKKLCTAMDAFNFDLKSFSDSFYKSHCKGRLNPVLESIKTVHELGKHLEITHLVIPGLNDFDHEFQAMTDWILEHLGPNVPLHLSAYAPRYKYNIHSTSAKTLERLYQIATQKLNFVYIGNLFTKFGQNTYCPKCQNLLVQRLAYQIEKIGLNIEENACKCSPEHHIFRT